MRESDRRRLVGAGTPRRRTRRPKAVIKESILHELAPNVARAIGHALEMDARTVVRDRDFDRPNPLRDFGPLIITVRWEGDFRELLRGDRRRAEERAHNEYGRAFHRSLQRWSTFRGWRLEDDSLPSNCCARCGWK